MVYRLFVNDQRTVLVRIWEGGVVEVAVRDRPGDIWGPAVVLHEEDTAAFNKDQQRLEVTP
jgi:hypothetical protein